MKQMLTFSRRREIRGALLQPQHWQWQWQLTSCRQRQLPHDMSREGVDESACEGSEEEGAKCKLQQISMFMAHVVRNFHTFDFLKDAQRVPPTQPYPTPSPCVALPRRVLCPSSGIAGSRSHSLALETQLPFLCHSSN